MHTGHGYQELHAGVGDARPLVRWRGQHAPGRLQGRWQRACLRPKLSARTALSVHLDGRVPVLGRGLAAEYAFAQSSARARGRHGKFGCRSRAAPLAGQSSLPSPEGVVRTAGDSTRPEFPGTLARHWEPARSRSPGFRRSPECRHRRLARRERPHPGAAEVACDLVRRGVTDVAKVQAAVDAASTPSGA